MSNDTDTTSTTCEEESGKKPKELNKALDKAKEKEQMRLRDYYDDTKDYQDGIR